MEHSRDASPVRSKEHKKGFVVITAKNDGDQVEVKKIAALLSHREQIRKEIKHGRFLKWFFFVHGDETPIGTMEMDIAGVDEKPLSDLVFALPDTVEVKERHSLRQVRFMLEQSEGALRSDLLSRVKNAVEEDIVRLGGFHEAAIRNQQVLAGLAQLKLSIGLQWFSLIQKEAKDKPFDQLQLRVDADIQQPVYHAFLDTVETALKQVLDCYTVRGRNLATQE